MKSMMTSRCVIAALAMAGAAVAADPEPDNLKALAQEVRTQIETNQYAAEMSAQGLTDVLKLGLAFYKKGVELAR